MTGFMCKIKAGDFWWDNLLIYYMLLPSAWAAVTLGSGYQRPVIQLQLRPRSHQAYSHCTAPAWAALLRAAPTWRALGRALSSLNFLVIKTNPLFWRVSHFFASAGQNITHQETRAHGSAALAVQRTGARARSHGCWLLRESRRWAESGWVRAQSYQRQRSSSGKSVAAQGHTASACPLLGRALTYFFSPPLLHPESTICNVPTCWAFLWISGLFLYHIPLCT